MGLKTYKINLSEFGKEGDIVMTTPGFARIRWCEAFKTKTARDGTPFDDLNPVDKASVHIMTYIRSAPFDIESLDAFVEFIDSSDEYKPGKGVELFKRLAEKADAIKSAETDPLVT